MDVDTVLNKTTSMDMFSMMMQQIPSDPQQSFYNNTFTNTNTVPLLNDPNNIILNDSNNVNLNFQQQQHQLNNYNFNYEKKSSSSSMAAMREMIFRIAVMQPIHIDPESIRAPKRRNVKISKDPQSVAARHRRERISERIRILQRLVPGGTKMDTASMLDEAIHYVKFLKKQLHTLEQVAGTNNSTRTLSHVNGGVGGFIMGGNNNNINMNMMNSNVMNYSSSVGGLMMKGCQTF